MSEEMSEGHMYSVQHPVLVRPSEAAITAWRALWDGYNNAFYGRYGECALPEHVTTTTWQRFFEDDESIFALVAERGNELIGLAHYLFYRSTTRVELFCYLQDLFTAESARGTGIGSRLAMRVASGLCNSLDL